MSGNNASATYSSGGAMGSSFMGGGNSSQTATQAPGRAQQQPQEESKSSFSAFGGRGTSLGSDIESERSTSTASSGSLFGGGSKTKATSKVETKKEEKKTPSVNNPKSAIVLAREEKERQDRAKKEAEALGLPPQDTSADDSAMTETVDLLDLDDIEVKKSGDEKGNYAPVENNNKYQM